MWYAGQRLPGSGKKERNNLNMFTWYLAILAIGVGFMPLTACLCRGFRDGGWMVSKTIGILLSVWVFFVLNTLHLLSFVMKNCRLVVGVLLLLNLVIYIGFDLNKVFRKLDVVQILVEEALFAGLLALWIYIISFKPEAYGTEKFMDYAFMTAMTRALYMPFEDMWFAGEAINYYYGGQFVAAWLTKLTGISVGVGYNAMRATVAAFSFTLPFSLAFQMMADRMPERRLLHYLSAAVSGTAVAYCGNMHYVIYALLKPLLGLSDGRYWFPDATRYIGYDPDLPDKTIHEFPAYSTILGDLHAHYVDIIFVVTVTAVAYAYGRRKLGGAGTEPLMPSSKRDNPLVRAWQALPAWLREALSQPEIWIIGIFTGLFRWTNYWDFPIYVVVCGSIVFFANLRAADYDLKRFLPPMLAETALVFAAGYVACLPFTSTFEMISSEIGPTHSHTRLAQLLVLWGLPVFAVLLFAGMLAAEYRKSASAEEGVPARFAPHFPDLAALLFALCGLGLVLLPEVIYVKDIYQGDYYRANTMFKLSYQAFILLGLVMGYVFIRAMALGKRAAFVLASLGLVCLILTGGYTFRGVRDWFGNVLDPSGKISRDASVFVGESFLEDFEAIDYLNRNDNGAGVVLEAPGDSYSDYERVSVATGLATPLGWYVHEWLWRSGTEQLNARAADIEVIYTGTDENEVRALVNKYDIDYIYIGVLEREKYPALNDALLQRLGDVAFSDGEQTYIIRVDQAG